MSLSFKTLFKDVTTQNIYQRSARLCFLNPHHSHTFLCHLAMSVFLSLSTFPFLDDMPLVKANVKDFKYIIFHEHLSSMNIYLPWLSSLYWHLKWKFTMHTRHEKLSGNTNRYIQYQVEMNKRLYGARVHFDKSWTVTIGRRIQEQNWMKQILNGMIRLRYSDECRRATNVRLEDDKTWS